MEGYLCSNCGQMPAEPGRTKCMHCDLPAFQVMSNGKRAPHFNHQAMTWGTASHSLPDVQPPFFSHQQVWSTLTSHSPHVQHPKYSPQQEWSAADQHYQAMNSVAERWSATPHDPAVNSLFEQWSASPIELPPFPAQYSLPGQSSHHTMNSKAPPKNKKNKKN